MNFGWLVLNKVFIVWNVLCLVLQVGMERIYVYVCRILNNWKYILKIQSIQFLKTKFKTMLETIAIDIPKYLVYCDSEINKNL